MFYSTAARRSTASIVAVGLTAVASVALLAGCAGGAGGSTSSSDSSKSSSASAPSSASASSVAVPANFPKDVPLVDGTVLEASGDADNGWTATVDPDSKNGFAKAQKALTNAGFTAQSTGTKTSATYANAAYTAIISTPGETVTYIISTR